LKKKYDITINYVTGWFQKSETTGFVIGWSAKDFGFGELTVSGSAKRKNGFFTDQTEWTCDSEDMSRDFVKAVLAKLGDTVKLECEKKKD
jgi:hypothetical protein